jgi:fluoride exporter
VFDVSLEQVSQNFRGKTKKMKTLLLVFIGGGAGSILRFALSKWLNSSLFPIGTLLANILASLFLGYITGKMIEATNPMKALLIIGFCGGFSTFSTFSNESFQYLQQGNYGLAALHAFLNLSLCLGGIGLGFYLGK